MTNARARCSIAAVAASSVTAGIAALALALTRAPSRDELHSLAQVDLGSWSRFSHELAVTSDRTPPAYYLFSWLAKPLLGDSLLSLRLVSVVAWAVGAAVLALVVHRRGPTWPVVLAAGLVPSATGLMSMGSYARPYALAFAAFAISLAAWEQSLSGIARRHLATLWVACSLAVAMHYAVALAVLIVLGGEVLARRRDPRRSRAMAIALLTTSWPVVLNAVQIHRSLDDLRTLPREVGIVSLPGWYASVLLPLVPALLAGAAIVMWARARPVHDPVAAARPSAAPRPAIAAWFAEPRNLVAGGLVVVLPALVVAVTAATSGAYLHRYALMGVVGLALLSASAVSFVGQRSRQAAWAMVGLIALCVPLAGWRAAGDRPSSAWADALPSRLHLAQTTEPIVFEEEYAYVLAVRAAPTPVDRRIHLGGTATIVGMHTWLDVAALGSGDPAGRSAPHRFVLVVDRNVLAELTDGGRITVLEHLGSTRLRYRGTDRSLVSVLVTTADRS